VAAVKFRELFDHCLRRKWNTDCSKPRRLCHSTRAVACRAVGLLSTRPRSPDGREGAGWPTGQLCVAWSKRNKAELKLGALPNTVQGSLLPTRHAHTQTHTHTYSGFRNGPTYLALALWLNSCKWSGVEWSYINCLFACLLTYLLTETTRLDSTVLQFTVQHSNKPLR